MKNTRVLIVDDEPGIRESLRGVLEDEGCACEAAESGEQCLEELRRHAFDVVTLGELLCALQVRIDGEGVVRLGKVLGTYAVVLGEGLLRLEGILLAGLRNQHLVLVLDRIEGLLHQVLAVQRDERIEQVRMCAMDRAPHHGHT